MRALLNRNVPVASSCLGKGVCSKCHIKILKGEQSLSPKTQLEIELITKNKIPENCRISCQSKVLGDIVVDTDYW